MLTQDDVRRRRYGGALAVIVGAVLLVLAVLAFTGRLGATDREVSASDAAISAGAQTTAAETPDEGQPDDDGQTDDDGQPDDPASTDEPDEPDEPVQAPLIVLNGGGIAGLAAQGQQVFQAAGWDVPEVGNYVGGALSQSTVFYPSGNDEAQAAAQNLAEQFEQLAVAPAPVGLGYDGVVVVLTGDWMPGA